MIEYGKKLNTPVVLCLGFFDCMHKGHLALYNKARGIADSVGAKVALFTFSNSHFDVLKKDVKPIYTFEERLEIYKNVGVDEVLAAKFDESFMATTGEAFLQTLLSTLNVKAVVCGFDYRCGCNMLTSSEVANICKSNSVDCFVVDAVTENGVKISSTLVRELLKKADIKKVNSLLSQNYFVSGKVVAGRQIGRTIGFPTANVAMCDKLMPQGVFSGYTFVDGSKYNALINIGNKPTFGETQVSVEAFLDGFNGDLYGKNICLFLTDYLRDVQKFSTAEELKQQLQVDLLKVKHHD